MNSLIVLAGAVVLAMAGWLLPEFYITVLDYVGLYTLVALGLVLLTGVAGITSFGQAAFVGLSAYTTATLTIYFSMSPWLSLVVAVVVTATAAAALGAVTLRLSGHYLPLGTIAWGISLYFVFGNMDYLGGHTGLDGLPPISIGPMDLVTNREIYFLIWAVTLAAMLLVANMLDSRAGRAMRAVKTSTETAESFGINSVRVKLIVFIYAAILAAISGWLYAHLLRFVNPSPFSLTMGIEYLFMAVVGGAGQVWGALLGAGIITLLKEYLSGALPQLFGQPGNFEIIIFGALVILLLQINRENGLSSLFKGRFPDRRYPDVSDASTLPRRERVAGGEAQPILSVRGITKSFGGLQALSDVGFGVARGEIVAIIGPNGAGKSTLFNAITGLLAVDGGEITIDGRRTNRLKSRDIVGLGIARTFQHVQLVPSLSVIENTMLGAHIRSHGGSVAAAFRLERREEAQLRAEALKQLRRVGLAELASQPADSLALGQQRLVEIARALCADPDVLLFDEPAAGLRYREKLELADLVRGLRQEGISIVLVEHDMEFVMKLADRIVVINFGEKLVEGCPSDVRSDPRVIEAYLGGSAA